MHSGKSSARTTLRLGILRLPDWSPSNGTDTRFVDYKVAVSRFHRYPGVNFGSLQSFFFCFFSFFMALLVLFLLSWKTFNSERSFLVICDNFEISLISSGRFWFFKSIVLYNIYKISVAILEYFWHSYTFHNLFIIDNFIILLISPNIFRFFVCGILHWYFPCLPFYEVLKYECGFIML